MRYYSMILLLVAFAFAGCEREPRDVPREYQNATPGHESRQLTQIVQNPTPPAFVWPGNPSSIDAVFSGDEMYARSFLVVLDVSGSMRGDKLEEAKAALRVFFKAMKPNDYVGLLLFSTENYLAVPLDRVDRVEAEFLRKVDAAREGGSTYLKNAVKSGYTELTRLGQLQLGYGNYTLVIVTDGAADNGQDPKKDILFMIENTPIQIYTIGFQIGSRHSLNMPGKTTYVEANNLGELTEGLKGVLAESLDMFQ